MRCGKEVTNELQHTSDIGFAEVITDKQKRAVVHFSGIVGKAVTEIQPGGTLTASPFFYAPPRPVARLSR
jgi:hypothetical protein